MACGHFTHSQPPRRTCDRPCHDPLGSRSLRSRLRSPGRGLHPRCGGCSSVPCYLATRTSSGHQVMLPERRSGTPPSSLSELAAGSGRRESNTLRWVGSPGSDHQTAPAQSSPSVSRRPGPDTSRRWPLAGGALSSPRRESNPKRRFTEARRHRGARAICGPPENRTPIPSLQD